ncbi:MAG: hypothetical protein UV58_C0022G0007 [Candidatus Wolfebacteria bacterium GW2011_GWC1_43_10]|uniref:Uncharacterized protein n=1 Tax=Candidatus Wolfebacteria bacterium GW2011_GWC1_43_10 TaxID=1619011 RepID=A0A0G1EEC9_9BACT|nr:MAG: hypothetical protein UV58_C0022G0007 [Candidatus Wolfebacteria bacterium GW2011_GWC1_43_10]
MSKFVRVLVIGFMTLSIILWSAGSALAVSVAADYTKTDVATDTFGRSETNQLVFNILLNNDVLIHNGATASVAGDPLIAFPADTKFIDSDNTGVYSDGKAILVSADGNLTAGVLSGAGTDDVITDGTADIAAFAATHFVYDDNASDNNDYDNGEAIIIDNDADGMPTAGDTVVTAGLAGVMVPTTKFISMTSTRTATIRLAKPFGLTLATLEFFLPQPTGFLLEQPLLWRQDLPRDSTFSLEKGDLLT